MVAVCMVMLVVVCVICMVCIDKPGRFLFATYCFALLCFALLGYQTRPDQTGPNETKPNRGRGREVSFERGKDYYFGEDLDVFLLILGKNYWK